MVLIVVVYRFTFRESLDLACNYMDRKQLQLNLQ